jgi:hypothetical protein
MSTTTTVTETTQPRFVQTTLSYLTPPKDGSRPYFSTHKIDPATGERETNYVPNHVEVQIEDLRGNEDSASLDTTGFQFGVAKSKVQNFRDEQEILDVYYPESIDLIKKATGAAKVVVFDHSSFYPYRTVVLSLIIWQPFVATIQLSMDQTSKLVDLLVSFM